MKSWLALGVDLAAVVGRALLFVAENLVGRIQFRELLGGFGFLALIRMIFLRELAESLLDLGFGGGPRNAERLVIILEFNAHDLFSYRPYVSEKLRASTVERDRDAAQKGATVSRPPVCCHGRPVRM